jgi:hypothetical protein
MNTRSQRRRVVGLAKAFFLVVIPLLSLFSSCGKNSNPTTPSDIVFPASNISYAQTVQPLFLQKCAFVGCHDDQSMAGGLSLTSYLALTSPSHPGVVIPGNSTNSILAQKIDGRDPHLEPIPTTLTSNQITGIKKWIDEGAKNN